MATRLNSVVFTGVKSSLHDNRATSGSATWAVSGPAQGIAITALKDHERVQEARVRTGAAAGRVEQAVDDYVHRRVLSLWNYLHQPKYHSG